MFEDFAEFAVGPWGFAVIAVYAASRTDKGRTLLRTAARNVAKVCYSVSEKGAHMFAEFKEEADDLIAEVKSEKAGKPSSGSKRSNSKTKQPKA